MSVRQQQKESAAATSPEHSGHRNVANGDADLLSGQDSSGQETKCIVLLLETKK